MNRSDPQKKARQTRSKTTAPPTRRKFVNAWDELEYLCDKLLYWVYVREDFYRAERYTGRLEKVIVFIEKAPGFSDTIKMHEGRSLIAEAEGDWVNAIKFRRKEIEQIEKLYQLLPNEQPSARELIRLAYTPDDLADRYVFLALNLWTDNQLNDALAVLDRAAQFCKEQGIEFDGDKIAPEIENELEQLSEHSND